MKREDQSEKFALGVSLVLCLGLVAIAIGDFDRSSSLTTPQGAQAQEVGESTNSSDSDSRNSVRAIGESSSEYLPQCTLSGVPIGVGSFGEDIFCLQANLRDIGLFVGAETGLFDLATAAAVMKFQSQQNLPEDGIVGRITGTKLGIWPPDPPTVVRTPVPAPGAVDIWGFPLSSVASTGIDAPPLPANSGSGYRLVFDRAAQRVWAVDETEIVIRSWLVSGSRENNEVPGEHKVYSRSRISTSLDGEATFSLMVRWLKTQDDAIGFHGLPRRTWDGSHYQTEDELGIPLSSGCQRQADLDAEFTWNFAPVGTTVVVL
jgi:peptidoglycan hydrolase-like protein with peptidoglycan-binding domain